MTDPTPTDRLTALENRMTRLESLTGHVLPSTPEPELDPFVLITDSTDDPENRTLKIKWRNLGNAAVKTQRVSRNGIDINGTGPWTSNPILPAQTEWTFGNLKYDTDYTFIVDVEFMDGTKDSDSWTENLGAAPTQPNPPTPTPGTRRIPHIGKSRLPFNLIYFAGGNPNLKRLEAFGAKLGRPLDGELTFLSRGSWASMMDAGMVKAVKEVHDSGRIVVISTPHAPPADNMNARGARNEYATEQKKMAALYASHGLNTDRIVWRVNWEFNLPNPWASNKSGPADLRDAVRLFAVNFRLGGLTNNRFDQCPNGDRSKTGHNIQDVYAGPDYVDVIGVDQYDQWPPVLSAADWAQKQKTNASITTNHALAATTGKGVMISVDECGSTHPKADGKYGGDNPIYWQHMIPELTKRAPDVAWLTLYDHVGAPATLHHEFATNPKAFAELKRQLALIETRTP